jgi:hypothetical protein
MRRCSCGGSQQLPLCDGSHTLGGWNCAAAAPRLGFVVAAGQHLLSFAERLAHARGGAVLHRLDGEVRAEELVVLTDGTDLPSARVDLARVRAHRSRALVVGAEPALLQAALPGMVCVAVEDDAHPAVLWARLMAALEQDESSAGPPLGRAPRVFLSHAVVDESELAGPVEALRRLGVEVFLCGDSMRAGADWRAQIDAALRGCDRFVLWVTAAAAGSVWCAYEAGVAMGLGKDIRLISADMAMPPGPLAHLYGESLPRLARLRPWLTPDDMVVAAVLASRGCANGYRG